MGGVLKGIYGGALVLAIVAGILLFLDARRLTEFVFATDNRALGETEFYRLATTTINDQFDDNIAVIHATKADWIEDIAKRDQFIGIGRYFSVGLNGTAEMNGELTPFLRAGKAMSIDSALNLVFDRASATIVGTPERCDAQPRTSLFRMYVPAVDLTGLCDHLEELGNRPQLDDVAQRIAALSKIIPVNMVRIASVKYIFVANNGEVSSDINDYVENPFPAELVNYFVDNKGLCTGPGADCSLPFGGQLEILHCENMVPPAVSKLIEPDEWNNLVRLSKFCIRASQETPVGKLFFYFTEHWSTIEFFLGGVGGDDFSELVESLYLLPTATRLNLFASISKSEFRIQTFWSSLKAFEFKVGSLNVSFLTAFIVLVALAVIDLAIWLVTLIIRRCALRPQPVACDPADSGDSDSG